ncbi:MAG: CpsB/CapC family capsule biosynthesis tyrosine phosphatase [Candidatus Acidiferrales bacterium]
MEKISRVAQAAGCNLRKFRSAKAAPRSPMMATATFATAMASALAHPHTQHRPRHSRTPQPQRRKIRAVPSIFSTQLLVSQLSVAPPLEAAPAFSRVQKWNSMRPLQPMYCKRWANERSDRKTAPSGFPRCAVELFQVSSLKPMVDIHCHILPGLDDGAATPEIALEMAEAAIADGITHVVATPHANADFAFRPELVQQLRDELQSKLGDRLTLGTGCDFHLSFENLQDARQHPGKYTINQKQYLLVELGDFAIPPAMDDTLHQLQLAGVSPIITHPERNNLLRAKPERLYGWLHQGCYVQVTAGSLLGRFGRGAAQWVEQWLKEDRIHFFASDAHSLTGRPLRLREAYKKVASLRGEEVAQALFQDNPAAAFDGRPLPYEPEQQEVAREGSRPKKKRFFFF